MTTKRGLHPRLSGIKTKAIMLGKLVSKRSRTTALHPTRLSFPHSPSGWNLATPIGAVWEYSGEGLSMAKAVSMSAESSGESRFVKPDLTDEDCRMRVPLAATPSLMSTVRTYGAQRQDINKGEVRLLAARHAVPCVLHTYLEIISRGGEETTCSDAMPVSENERSSAGE